MQYTLKCIKVSDSIYAASAAVSTVVQHKLSHIRANPSAANTLQGIADFALVVCMHINL